MSSTNATDLERALLRSGDDLYRLALLLADDEAAAARALIKMVRRLAVGGGATDEPALIMALLAALPPERRGWRPGRPRPAWARAAPAERAALLAALAGLPRPRRLALGLTMLRSYEPEQAAPLIDAAGSPATPHLALDWARIAHDVRERIDRVRAGAGVSATRGPNSEQLGQPRSGAAVVSASSSPEAGVEGDPAGRSRAVLRDALLALAPAAVPAIPASAFDSAGAPEACRSTRAALALNDPALHSDAAIRGHLALCSACRAAEQAWHSLGVGVEEALRAALRDVRLPPALADQIQAAAQPAGESVGQMLIANPRARIALVALPVLALIAFLVWPRGAPPTPTGRAPAAQAPSARDLVQRARDQLYVPTPGQGVWHASYEIQWAFPDDTTALLAADAWLDPSSGRHRVQLVHHDGGGPYEFELADGANSAWYAVSDNYVSSLYPLSYNRVNRVQLQATPAEQRRMLEARLAAGAWDLAGSYLRQAETAELRTWGRQRDADGALLDLISFSGVSPLALPPDAPNATTSRVTVLLAIDEASGRLRQVRELIGPAGSEQTTRTTWRLVSEEWIDAGQSSDRLFQLRDAWNGVGAFARTGQLADPALPIIGPEAVTSLAIGYQLGWTGLWMSAGLPPGAGAALLINHGPRPIRGNQFYDSMRLTFVYLGAGRRMEINTTPNAATPLIGGELVELDGRQAIILPRNGQGYQAQINHSLDTNVANGLYTTQVAAFGYTRAELLEVLRGLGSPTLAGYLAQARLFADPVQGDRAAFEALLDALAPAPSGEVRHFVERVYKRQDGLPDRLPDPYHRPRYGGWPEQLIQDNWARGGDDPATAERAATTSGSDGTVYARQYIGPELVWYYDAPANSVRVLPSRFLGMDQRTNEDQNIILRMLACGGATLQTAASGMRAVVLIEENWRADGSCVQPEYAWLYQVQTANDPDGDQTPYLADRTESQLTTLVGLDADGRAVRIEIWAGLPESGVLLQSWELVDDESLPAERVPASAFDARPPDALQRWIFEENQPERPAPHSITITRALELAQSPLFELPMAPAGRRTIAISSTGDLTPTNVVLGAPPLLNSIAAGAPPDAPGVRWENERNVFDQAVEDGFAIRFSYTISDTDGNLQATNLYQGAEKTLGAYLRGSAVWRSSSAATLQIGDRQVGGWRVVERRGDAEWLLFELDGTLIAAESPTNELLAALTQFRRVTR